MRIKRKRLRSDQGGFRAGTGTVVKDRNVLGGYRRRPGANITISWKPPYNFVKLGRFYEKSTASDQMIMASNPFHVGESRHVTGC
jgi:hypothetical protein